MSEIGDKVTLLDLARRVDASGNIPAIAEMMTETNEVLIDMPWIEGNQATGHLSIIRNGLPDVAWRKLNYGVPPSKSTTTKVTDTCGMLESWSQVDQDLVELNGNTVAFRNSEDRAFIEAMNQEMAGMVFYGDTSTDPEKILGLSPRFAASSATVTNIGYNILKGGGVAGDNTSVWLVVWGPQTVHGIYPKGSKAGLIHQDLGLETVTDAAGGNYRAYRSRFQWKCGLTVKDWRYIVRIANLDVSDIGTAGDQTDTSANLIKLMLQAMDRVPSLSMGKPVFYCNKDVMTALRIKLLNKSNAYLSMEDITGAGGISRKSLTFMGVPVRRVDQILNNESLVS